MEPFGSGHIESGLSRLDKDGHWQNYNKANTNGDLPNNGINALAVGTDGTLWVGTSSGLVRFDKNKRWQTYTWENTGGGLPLEFRQRAGAWVGWRSVDRDRPRIGSVG